MNGTYRTLASVCRRFFRYRLWYFCRSPMLPCSACILGARNAALCAADADEAAIDELLLVAASLSRWLANVVFG